jgi:hypothetical protein
MICFVKPRTLNLPEAQRRLAEAIEAANEVATYLTGLSATLGLSDSRGVNGTVPNTMAERVIKIVSDMGKPLKPKAIVDRYELLGWPAPEGGRQKLYEAVAGSLSYLVNRKKVLEKTKKGYSMMEEKK